MRKCCAGVGMALFRPSMVPRRVMGPSFSHRGFTTTASLDKNKKKKQKTSHIPPPDHDDDSSVEQYAPPPRWRIAVDRKKHPAAQADRVFNREKDDLVTQTVGKTHRKPSMKLDVANPLSLTPLSQAYMRSRRHYEGLLASVSVCNKFEASGMGDLAVPVTGPGSNIHSGSSGSSSGTGSQNRRNREPVDGHGDKILIFPLSELAQIVPRQGRAISLLVNERRFIKPIMSAVQNSPLYNQQPQRSADNELELLMRVEPERPEDLRRRVEMVGTAWRDAIRDDRNRYLKMLKGGLRTQEIDVRPDAVRALTADVQNMQDDEMKRISEKELEAFKRATKT